MRARSPLLARAAAVSVIAAFAGCFDLSTRWEGDPQPAAQAQGPTCTVGDVRCAAALERCEGGPKGPAWVLVDDCASHGEVCAATLGKCAACAPGRAACQGLEVRECKADGSVAALVETCDASKGEACREGGCVNLCSRAAQQKSNVGCEYWAVDLDNAMIDATSNAAAQQFAVVVSNPQPDVPAVVTIYQDDGAPGDAPAPYEIASAVIAPLNLQVFKLGPREVDGSPPGEFNTGTNTALTRHAYKVTSNYPVVAYQFNPLDNVNVFSNDASLLKPREALEVAAGAIQPAYVVVGWPQTIAITDDPSTNFSPSYPIALRAFLTIVGTKEQTHVRVRTKTAVVAGGPVAATPAGGVIEATIGAFDVLNLETDDFNADFTGSIVEADAAVAVFTGSEASDAPHFTTLSDRRCCADHLEDQLDPIRAAGKRFAIAHDASRTQAVAAAGGQIVAVPEPDFVRFVATTTAGATIHTTLDAPDDVIHLQHMGDFREVTALRDFMAESTDPITVQQVMASQDAAGVKRGLPGGDPSILIEPPIEQFRSDYVFLTPDKYMFDFITVVAPPGATVLLDETPLDDSVCEIGPADGLTFEQRGKKPPELFAYRCQLSFPVIDPSTSPPTVKPGTQNDGVHRIRADVPVGLVVTGFDSYVSYAYAGGQDLREIALPN
jgi:hypothetical protein